MLHCCSVLVLCTFDPARRRCAVLTTAASICARSPQSWRSRTTRVASIRWHTSAASRLELHGTGWQLVAPLCEPSSALGLQAVTHALSATRLVPALPVGQRGTSAGRQLVLSVGRWGAGALPAGSLSYFDLQTDHQAITVTRLKADQHLHTMHVWCTRCTLVGSTRWRTSTSR